MSCAPTRFVFVRHGQTVWNAEGRWQGWLDSPLTAHGREQVRGAQAAVAAERPVACYASPSGRAMESACIVCEGLGLSVIPHDGLRERNYGGFEGLSTAEIDRQFPGARYDPSRDLRETWRPPEGESLAEVRDRLRVFLDEAAVRHPGSVVAAVTHSGVLRCVAQLAAGVPFEDLWDRHPPNAAVVVAEWDGSGLRVLKDFPVPAPPFPGTAPTAAGGR